jgi:hypothetical protein
MSVDATLKAMVDNLISQTTYHTQSQSFDAILYQWSKGAIESSAFNAEFVGDSNLQTHNGELIRFDIDDDLRQKLAVLETMSAEDILSRETWQITTEQTDAGESVKVYSFKTINRNDSQALYEQAYQVLEDYQFSQVLKQTLLEPLFQSLELAFIDDEINIDTSATETLMAEYFTSNHDNAIALTIAFNEAYGKTLSKYDFDYLSILKDNSPIFAEMTLEEMTTRIENEQILFVKNTQSINAKDSQAHWLIGLAGDDTLKNKNISTLATNDTLANNLNLADNQQSYLKTA